MDMNAVCWFEIYVDDLGRAKAFYEAVLAVELTKLGMEDMPAEVPKPEMLVFPMKEAPGATGALCKMDGVKAGGNSTLIYFSCEDCSIEAARVDAAGGKLIAPKFSIGPHGFIAIAQDTEGNNIGLHSAK